jgi:hypothetical protein
MKDKETKENKGFAFVTFTAKDVAQRAIEELHDKDHKVMCGFSLQDIVGSLACMIMMHNVEWFCAGENTAMLLVSGKAQVIRWQCTQGVE